MVLLLFKKLERNIFPIWGHEKDLWSTQGEKPKKTDEVVSLGEEDRKIEQKKVGLLNILIIHIIWWWRNMFRLNWFILSSTHNVMIALNTFGCRWRNFLRVLIPSQPTSFLLWVSAGKRWTVKHELRGWNIFKVVATLLWEVRGKDAKAVRAKIREEVWDGRIQLTLQPTEHFELDCI